jgi:hypothetical protein
MIAASLSYRGRITESNKRKGSAGNGITLDKK